MRLTGREAIEAAESDPSIRLQKYADPVDDAREVTSSEARDIAREDAGLIWCEIPKHSSKELALMQERVKATATRLWLAQEAYTAVEAGQRAGAWSLSYEDWILRPAGRELMGCRSWHSVARLEYFSALLDDGMTVTEAIDAVDATEGGR